MCSIQCTLVGTFRGTLTNGEEHRAGALTASLAGSAVAEDSSLLGHQVVLEGLDQQVLALSVVTHQQLCVHVTHQEVSFQQRQPHALHQLGGGTAGRWVVRGDWMVGKITTDEGEECNRGCVGGILGSGKLNPRKSCETAERVCLRTSHPWYMLPSPIYVVFDPAQHSSIHLLL